MTAQFLVALVKVAVARYVLAGELVDVSQAVDRLLRLHVRSHLGLLADFVPDHFRRNYCYTKEVCRVLKRGASLLRNCFAAAVRIGSVQTNEQRASRDGKYIPSADAWLAALRLLDLLEDDLSERDALRCYSYSRMVVDDPRSKRGQMKMAVLPFEGFMEALCHMAALKALPTDDEIRHAGCGDAGSYMAALKLADPPEYRMLQEERRHRWGSEKKPPSFHRRVEHTIALFHKRVMAHTCVSRKT